MRGRLLTMALLCANLMLAPLGMVHAHIAEADHAVTHAGHLHAFDHASDHHDGEPIVELDKFPNPLTAKMGWLGFVAVFFLVALWRWAPRVSGVVRTRKRSTEPITRRPRISPPLRGPPCSVA
jgi:hypothetical protein